VMVKEHGISFHKNNNFILGYLTNNHLKYKYNIYFYIVEKCFLNTSLSLFFINKIYNYYIHMYEHFFIYIYFCKIKILIIYCSRYLQQPLPFIHYLYQISQQFLKDFANLFQRVHT